MRDTSQRKLLVADVMTRDPVRIGAADRVSRARAIMGDVQVRHLPVVDDAGLLVGILSDRDCLPAPAAARVEAVMTPDPETVFPDTPAFEAAAIMIQRRFGSLPVIDPDRRVVGMITETDLLIQAYRALSRDAPAPMK